MELEEEEKWISSDEEDVETEKVKVKVPIVTKRIKKRNMEMEVDE